jgi:glucose/mannose-6-phosphate isomerase
VLDDPIAIAKYDKANALGVIGGQPAQLTYHYSLGAHQFAAIDTIVVAGMGGSALAAELVQSWLVSQLPVPVTIIRDYDLPAFVGPHTLVICASSSGNTEETVAAFQVAQERKAQLVAIATGGKLAELAKQHKYPFLAVPGHFEPRFSVLYALRGLAEILEGARLATGLVEELERAADWAGGLIESWAANNKTETNEAKQLARQLAGFAVVIYSGPTLGAAALRWKQDMHENAKNVASVNVLSEFSHNEMSGWQYPRDKRHQVIELQSSLDHPQVQKRFEIGNRLLSGTMPAPIIVRVQGETRLQQLIWTLLLADYTSVYLAVLNGVDPTPLPLADKLKAELA